MVKEFGWGSERLFFVCLTRLVLICFYFFFLYCHCWWEKKEAASDEGSGEMVWTSADRNMIYLCSFANLRQHFVVVVVHSHLFPFFGMFCLEFATTMTMAASAYGWQIYHYSYTMFGFAFRHWRIWNNFMGAPTPFKSLIIYKILQSLKARKQSDAWKEGKGRERRRKKEKKREEKQRTTNIKTPLTML